MNLLSTLILSLLLSISIFTGRVVRVTDGDTIVILVENHEQIKVRLDRIDCSETKQDFGTRAKQATSDLKAKIGIWSQPNPIAPWDFRRN